MHGVCDETGTRSRPLMTGQSRPREKEGPIFDCRAEMKSVQGAADHREDHRRVGVRFRQSFGYSGGPRYVLPRGL